MNIKQSAFIVLLLIPAYFGFGQSPDYANKFTNGKALFTAGKYALAMEALKNLTKADQQNAYTEYASYYYALSAYRLNQYDLAKNMFLQLGARSPNWKKSKEVDYWLSHIYFENGDYDLALERSSETKSDEGIAQMKMHFLGKINSVDSLQGFLERHPYDNSIAEVLAIKIAGQPILNRNQELLDFLISEFELDEEKLRSLSIANTVMKDKYKVSVLFPFMNDRLSPSRNRNRRPFVLDMYEGMSIAKDSLRRKRGIEIDLCSFDTKKDSAATQNVLNSIEFLGTDLIVGPLFPQTYEVVNEYSFTHQVNMVNPMSSNSQVIGTNPFSFLYMPSNETYAMKAAEFVKEDIENKNAIIFYSPRDSVLAQTYKQIIEQDSFNVVVMEALPVDETGKILKILTGENSDEELLIAPDSIGHVFIASSKELVITNAISAIDIRRDMIPLFINEAILDFRSVSFSQLERLGTRIVSTKYVDSSRPKASNFVSRYSRVHGVVPSKYVCLGYELMYFFGMQLNEYGTLFQHGFMEENKYTTELQSGVEYERSNDNQFIRMLAFEDAVLKSIEPGEINESKSQE